MDKLNVLKQKAIEFQKLLEKYAETDDDVEDFLRRITPWFVRISNNKVELPCNEYQLSVYFTNPDLSPLADKYLFSGTELGKASSEFTAAIRGW